MDSNPTITGFSREENTRVKNTIGGKKSGQMIFTSNKNINL